MKTLALIIILTSLVNFLLPYVMAIVIERKSFLEWLRWLFKKWFLLLLVIFSMWLPFWQYLESENVQHDKDIASAKEIARKDSLSREDSKQIIESLAKYNFRYDSTQQKVIQLLRDSIKSITVNANEPDLNWCGHDGIVIRSIDDSHINYYLKICAYMATCDHINAKFKIIIQMTDMSLVAIDSIFQLGYSDVKISPNNSMSWPYVLNVNPDNVNGIIIQFSATYTDLGGKKKYKTERTAAYDLKRQVFGDIPEPTRKDVITKFKSIK